MSHRFSRADGLTPEGLHEIAVRDLKAAETLLKADTAFSDSAAYLAHRAVGLLFKAWLLATDGEFKDKYELSKLYSRVQEGSNPLELSAIEIDALVKLSSLSALPVAPPDGAAADDEALDWERVRSLFNTLASKLPQGTNTAAA